MKKSAIISVIAISVLLVSSSAIVSASWFGDFWCRITKCESVQLSPPDGANTAKLIVTVKNEKGSIIGAGRMVTLHLKSNPLKVKYSKTTNSSSTAKFTNIPPGEYYLWVAGITGRYKSWTGASCPFTLSTDESVAKDVCFEPGRGTSVCSKCPSQQCNKNNFKFAFVLLGRNESDITPAKINKVTEIKTQFKDAFSYATSNLARADISYPVKTIIDNGSLMNPEKTEFYRDWIAKKFLESNPDEFDFIIAFTAFPALDGAIMDSFNVDYDIYGIGLDSSVDYTNELERQYGFKQGEIKTNILKDVVYWSPTEALDLYVCNFFSNGLLHEVGHHWCCFVGDNFAKGQNNAQLEIIQQGIHFYRGLQSPSETGDPMNSDNWVSNNDGTYRRDNKEGIKKYHPFQLYFMGLLPESDYSKNYTLYDAGIIGIDFNDQQAVFYKNVSVNDIMAVEGKRRCSG